MKVDCPNPTDPRYQELLGKLGGNQAGAFRMWKHYENLHPGKGYEMALQIFGKTAEYKKEMLRKYTSNISENRETHTYTWNGDLDDGIETREMQSMSSIMDSIPELRLYKIERENLYMESGTDIHDFFHMIVKSSDPVNDENLKKFADDNKFSKNLLLDLVALKTRLQKMGSLESEILVYAPGDKVRLAGRADMILYKNNGEKIIIDIKNSYLTDQKIRDGKKAWDPSANSYQKAKRYAFQTIGYGRMTEFADGQAVSDHWIIPIEHKLNVDNDLSFGYKSSIVHPEESIRTWGTVEEYATKLLDNVFGKDSYPAPAMEILGTDDSTDIYLRLTGELASSSLTLEEQAKKVKRGSKNGVDGYYDLQNNYYPFNSTNPSARIQQIIDEYLNKLNKVNFDLSVSIANYIRENDVKYLRTLGNRVNVLANTLSVFAGRKDIIVSNVSDIKGFEDKKNWILITERDNKTTHLLYVGAENLKQTFDTGSLNTSLFKRFLDMPSAIRLNSAYRNTLGDARKFEGTLIALKLKEANPDITFGLTMAYGIGQASEFGDIIDLKEGLETLKSIVNHPVLSQKLLGNNLSLMRAVSNKDLLDHNNYGANWLTILTNYIQSRKNLDSIDEKKENLVDKLNEYNLAEDQSKRKKMLALIHDYFRDNVLMGRNPNSDEFTFLLSQFYMTMQKIDVSMLPVNVWNRLLSLPQNISDPLLQKLNEKLHTSANNLSDKFWNEYKTKYQKAIDEFLNYRNAKISLLGLRGYVGLDAAKDALNPMGTSSHYDELFVMEKRKQQTAEGEKEVTVNTFRLHSEDSVEFKNLSPEGQKLIKMTNELIKHYTTKNNIPWNVKGAIPLVRAKVSERLNNARKTGLQGQYRKILSDMLLDLESSFGAGEDTEASNVNIFHSQSNRDEFVDRRIEMLGFQGDNFVNAEKYNRWTNDLESIMDVFVVESLRHESFNELSTSLKAANSIINWYNSNLLGERLEGNFNFVNAIKTINLDNRDLDAHTNLNKISRILTRGASIGLYAFNPATALASWMGNEVTMFSQTMANTMSKSGRFRIGSVTRANLEMAKIFGQRAFNPDALEKVSLLMQKFRMFNDDISSFLNGYHKKGEKFLFRSKYMFSMLSAADYMTRMTVLIAQLMEDGSWNAFSVVDGQLKYDETKDDRFNGNGKLSKEQAAALRKVLGNDFGYSDDGKLKFGYDNLMINSMRNFSNYVFGTNDRESRSVINFLWYGKIFTASKNFLISKLDRYMLGVPFYSGAKRVESATMGEYVFEKDKDGNVIPMWKGDHLEGIFISWLAVIDNLRRTKEQKTPLTQIQKNNIYRSLGDVIIYSLAIALLSRMYPDDEELTPREELMIKSIRNGLDDLMVIYVLLRDPTFVVDSITLSYAESAVKNMFNSFYEVNPEKLLKSIPIARQLDKYYTAMENEDYEFEKH